MENKKLNLCEILKGKENTKIYCVLFGYGNITEVNNNFIIVQDKYDTTWYFEPNGTYSDDNCEEGECLLFPSRDNRDWSTFKPKRERFDPKMLKPFDKVLVRDNSDASWKNDFFGFICKNKDYPYCCLHGSITRYCIPYNDETKHLIGTTDEAPEYYKYWED